MEHLNAMMGNLNLQGGNDQGGIQDQGGNFYDQDGGNFNPIFDNYLQNESRGMGNKKMGKGPSSKKMGGMDYNQGPNLMQIGTLPQQPQPSMLSPWEEDNMMNPNMGGMGMKMNFNDNNAMNFYGQEKRGGKKQPRKGNNKQGGPNFNQPGQFDPMAFQNPNIYNAYYNTGNQNMGGFQNAQAPFIGKQGGKNMMGGFNYDNQGMSPFNLMGMNALNNLNMPGLNMGMGMPGMNMGGMGNMPMPGFNQKPHKNRNEVSNMYQKKEMAVPP